MFYKRIPLITLFPEDTVHSCAHCDQKFKTADALDKHNRAHYDSAVNKCDQCQLGFDKKRHLEKHVRAVHPDSVPLSKLRKTYECHVCHRVFLKKKERKKHVQTHIEAGMKIHVCKVCNKSYRAEKTLKLHMIKHGSDDKKPRCKVCNKMFSHPFSLRYHMRIHNNSKPCVCKICNQAFRQTGHLKRHLATHSDTPKEKRVRQYKCDLCQRQFVTIQDLKQHKLVHNGEKKFSCSVCSKSFLFKRTLEHHMNTHTGTKPYPCNKCDKSFAQPGSLHKHKQTHIELQPPHVSAANNDRRAKPEPKPPTLRRLGIKVQPDAAATSVAASSMPQVIINNGNVLDTTGAVIQLQNTAAVSAQQVAQPILFSNQLQPIHNTPPELDNLPPQSRSGSEHMQQQRAPAGGTVNVTTAPEYRSDCLEPFTLQHVHFQFHHPHQSAFKQKAPQEVPQNATYWTTPHLQQPNVIHYQPNPQNVQMFLPPPNNQHLQQ